MVEEQLATLGITFDPGSRIGTYIRLIRADIDKGTDANGAVDLARAHLEVSQLAVILEASDRLGPREAYDERVRDLISGHSHPSNEGKHTPARNAQFELYMAALFARAGIPSQLAEPDVVFELGNATLGLAAKRVKSRSAFRERLRDGLRQVSLRYDQGDIEVGVIAVDISVLVLNEYGVLAFDSRTQKRQWFTEQIKSFDSMVRSDLSRRDPKSLAPLAGVLACFTGQTMDSPERTLVNDTVISSIPIRKATKGVMVELRSRIEAAVD